MELGTVSVWGKSVEIFFLTVLFDVNFHNTLFAAEGFNLREEIVFFGTVMA